MSIPVAIKDWVEALPLNEQHEVLKYLEQRMSGTAHGVSG